MESESHSDDRKYNLQIRDDSEPPVLSNLFMETIGPSFLEELKVDFFDHTALQDSGMMVLEISQSFLFMC